MTGLNIFYNAFEEHWLEFKHPARVNVSWVKVIDLSPKYSGDVGSNVRVISVYKDGKIGPRKNSIDKIKNIINATENLSYYKLFKNCIVVKDEEKINELTLIEVKLRLL